jgi:hypothetical protein
MNSIVDEEEKPKPKPPLSQRLIPSQNQNYDERRNKTTHHHPSPASQGPPPTSRHSFHTPQPPSRSSSKAAYRSSPLAKRRNRRPGRGSSHRHMNPTNSLSTVIPATGGGMWRTSVSSLVHSAKRKGRRKRKRGDRRSRRGRGGGLWKMEGRTRSKTSTRKDDR